MKKKITVQMENKENKESKPMQSEEISSEELEELAQEVYEESYWKKCFDQLDRMKTHQDKYRKIDIEKFNKKYTPEGKEVDRLELQKDSLKASLYYYSGLSNYLRLAEMDNSDALLRYKHYQKKYREIQTYIENAKGFNGKEPSWNSYCDWSNKRKQKKAEMKPKKN